MQGLLQERNKELENISSDISKNLTKLSSAITTLNQDHAGSLNDEGKQLLKSCTSHLQKLEETLSKSEG